MQPESPHSRRNWVARERRANRTIEQIECHNERRRQRRQRTSSHVDNIITLPSSSIEQINTQSQRQRRNMIARERTTGRNICDNQHRSQHRQMIHTTNPPTCIIARQPFDGRDVSIQHSLHRMDIICRHCFAKHWIEERVLQSTCANPHFSMCCAQGRVQLPTVRPPPEPFRALFEEQTDDAKEFCTHIRAYNNCFAFTSAGANIDHTLLQRPRFPAKRAAASCESTGGVGTTSYRRNTTGSMMMASCSVLDIFFGRTSLNAAKISRHGKCHYSTTKVIDVGQPTSETHPQLLKYGEITPGITSDEYIQRRRKLIELLPAGSLAIIAAAPLKMMTDVVPYTYRQDSDYLYISGCQQPGGVGVLGHDCGLCMFMPESKLHDIIWNGNAAGVDAALDVFKADQAFPMSKLSMILPEMIGRCTSLFCSKTTFPDYIHLEATLQNAKDSGKVHPLSSLTHKLRWIKSPAEILLIKESASIASQALRECMLHSMSIPFEGYLAAKFEYECKMRGAQRMAFNPVVGSGPNASVIHYSRDDRYINEGDVVLMDVGCEMHGYVSDLTRTWQLSPRFSSPLEELYELILNTNKECIKLCRPGRSIQEIHNHSVDMLRQGFKEIGILNDDRNSNRNYHLLNPTNIGHYLGMDVHDCSEIPTNQTLEPGVVITIEPGVYIPPFLSICPERYRRMGVRVEDDILITETGHEVLTAGVPKEVSDIEALLSQS